MNSIIKYWFLKKPLEPLNTIMNKSLCNICHMHPVTVNYVRKDKTYYRKVCYYCIKKLKTQKELPKQLLKKSGYKKKTVCDRCNFKSKTPDQMKIHYKDDNNLNLSVNNLRSYCLNCITEIASDPRSDHDVLADY